ncbi:MAG: site-2 protease family protein [Thermoguttaceae bacterium]|nr:site-2 protease family protein [Thermoguttaceae bacterium]
MRKRSAAACPCPFDAAGTRRRCPYRLDGRFGVVPPRRSPAKKLWPAAALCFFLTFASTTYVGQIYARGGLAGGLMFSVPLMTILLCHELGHYLQTRRYKVFSTPPYFIPIPYPPFGTFGAVIEMDAHIPNRRALFDIGISGPLAGLVPTFLFLAVGLSLSSCVGCEDAPRRLFQFGEPLILRWLSRLVIERPADGGVLILHPIATAAWTGLFITTLNLFPLSQLDGGHVFYALTGRAARRLMLLIYLVIVAAVIVFHQWQWIVMLLILCFLGIYHPATADDSRPIGWWRTLLGWLILAFLPVGFTPSPISQPEHKPLDLAPMLSRDCPSREPPAAKFLCPRWSSGLGSDTILSDTVQEGSEADV